MDDEGGRLLMERPTDGQTENGDFIGPFIGWGSNNFLQTRKKKIKSLATEMNKVSKNFLYWEISNNLFFVIFLNLLGLP